MAVKTDRLEARLSPDERERIKQAAATAGLSVSAFVAEIAVERADQIIAATTPTVVPADYFDDLLAAHDDSANAPRLAEAAKRSRRSNRIAALGATASRHSLATTSPGSLAASRSSTTGCTVMPAPGVRQRLLTLGRVPVGS